MLFVIAKVDIQKSVQAGLNLTGLKVSDILNVLRLEKREALSFNEHDVRNYVWKEVTEFYQKLDQKGARDVVELLKTLKEKHEKDNRFFYDFIMDEDERLENILWIPGSVKDVANMFADVVVFDTTYRLNRYKYAVWLFCWCQHSHADNYPWRNFDAE
ncbi:hypothetical protein R1sor_018853 [Riccia sorocarpa]|uniref:Protein FAR1-RELATED SEQUENCE n=1 Tax=Riccia sorocarpa TaxID=122646 RepID=A0ABD3IC09_9MARC